MIDYTRLLSIDVPGNAQGDIIGIVNTSGTVVVSYTYDAWGNLLSVTGTMANTLGALNPLRYRGYVYDTETGLYYLQSRYYDPSMGRFICADGLTSTGQGTLGTNMFAYCGNNPVMYSDSFGMAPAWWQWVFSGAAIVAGAVLIATGVGGIAGGVLLSAGVNSIIGSYVNEAAGGSSIAGWVGGGIAGAGAAAGAGYASALFLAATETINYTAISYFCQGLLMAFSTGSASANVGNYVTARMDNTEYNPTQSTTSTIVNGFANIVGMYGSSISSVFGEAAKAVGYSSTSGVAYMLSGLLAALTTEGISDAATTAHTVCKTSSKVLTH